MPTYTIPARDDPFLDVADDFWTATSLDAFSNRRFVDRLLAADVAPPPIDPLSGSGEITMLDRVDDRFQRRLQRRRSRREFHDRPLAWREVERLLAATGIDGDGLRVVPSAGGLRSVSTFAICRRVEGALGGRVVRLLADRHAVQDVAPVPSDQQLRQFCNLDGPTMPGVVVVFVAELGRLRAKYGARADRFALIETGCAAQNVELRLADRGLAGYQLGGVRSELDAVLGIPDRDVVVTGAIAAGHLA